MRSAALLSVHDRDTISHTKIPFFPLSLVLKMYRINHIVLNIISTFVNLFSMNFCQLASCSPDFALTHWPTR